MKGLKKGGYYDPEILPLQTSTPANNINTLFSDYLKKISKREFDEEI